MLDRIVDTIVRTRAIIVCKTVVLKIVNIFVASNIEYEDIISTGAPHGPDC